MKIRGQHYVWRYYLQAWADGAGVIHCLRDGRVFPVQPKDVAKERDFYRLKSLTQEDIAFIERFSIKPAPPHLQKLHRNLIAAFTKITTLNDAANSSLPEGHEVQHTMQRYSQYEGMPGNEKIVADCRYGGAHRRYGVQRRTKSNGNA